MKKIKESDKITILALSWRDITSPNAGGAEVHTHEMLRRVDKNKYRIYHLATRKDGQPENEVIDGVTYLRHGNAITVITAAMRFYFLNKENIDYLSDYLTEAATRWSTEIESGKLVLPAHIMSTYNIPHPEATSMQWDNLRIQMNAQWDNPLVRHIKKHYEGLLTTKHNCTIYRWAASVHFLGENILSKEGIFTAYRCGMRGIGKIGEFSVQNPNLLEIYRKEFQEKLDVTYDSYHCGCLVDWYAIDLIIKGEISLEDACQWFVLFQDETVQTWIKAYQNKL